MTQLVGSDAPGDDVAVRVVHRQDSGEIGPLDLVVPALPWSLRDIRVAMRRWLSAVGAAPRTVATYLPPSVKHAPMPLSTPTDLVAAP
jgi:hypothetical protein